ncbi:hemerythrin domain-containing protein [Wenjunlia tyrosinilytica]|uniref:Hemerythrin n=1 Tax=Wenjunlia tyrosinilytica TaxID=1544741 RepID=A0A917ZRR5_9ACTN|nr:hemerythrin domain-containing protein [Wenjunlia tyrosinilytica]GGO90339.1 hemerythrin [Wenjunlia tyrosinilytica]
MGHGGNVIEELTADHREVEELFARIEIQPVGDKRRRELVDELTIELVRHSVAEEQYLYPAVREHLEGGDALADKEIEDHAKAERMLKDLEGREADDERFDSLVALLKFEVTDHVRDEEGRLFPMLASACGPQVLDELGDKVRKAKRTAPTRPHPAAPDTPPANRLLGPGVGLVDRARDMITGRGRHG